MTSKENAAGASLRCNTPRPSSTCPAGVTILLVRPTGCPVTSVTCLGDSTLGGRDVLCQSIVHFVPPNCRSVLAVGVTY